MNPELYHSLPTATPDEFLPPIDRWSTLGGLALLLVFGGSLVLAARLSYQVAVHAPAIVRPEGDLRLVQAAITGTVQSIEVKSNDQVEAGEVIAYLTDAELRVQERQLLADLEQTQKQVQQLQAQSVALEAQISAEARASERSVAAARANLNLLQREYQDRQATTQTDVQEAEAAVRFAEEELDRYQQLAETGALSALQISEKRASLAIAQVRLKRAIALQDPNPSAVEQAEQAVEQDLAMGESTLARLRQDQENLLRQRGELQKQQQSTEQQLQQLQLDLEKLAIRAPVSGTIQELVLRNPSQVVAPGDVIAQILPIQAPLVIQAQVEQESIGNIEIGQEAIIRIDSCVYTDYGTLTGWVTGITPDTKSSNQDPLRGNTAGSFYEVTITPQDLVLSNAGKECRIQSGMQGRADVITDEETILISWLRKLRLATDF
ncbi:MAG: HlyD family efflux transporter periplasmic adaptor subunit [Synechococcaceae cyanobacterium SM2_3_1]|nr:HlyD family efflux transporter periplasmic adaptor subunit [Synechococcaceae cyanobacterium SM2_3_1]